MKESIIILGMHRSGTSVLSGLVSLQGFHLGTSRMPLRDDNPKGFFENHAIYRFNQLILEEYGTSWDNYSFTFEQIKPDDLQRYQSQAKEIIKKEFGLAKRIFIKDPRMCLLFPLWEAVLKDLGFNIKVIYVYRSPMEVALSLKSRNDMVLEKSLLMWSHYCFQAEKNSRNYERMVVHYAHDFRDLDVFFKSLSEFLDIELSKEMYQGAHDLYTPGLIHHQVEMDNISDEVPVYLKDFIEVLRDNKLNKSKQLDKIFNEFYYSQHLYLYDEVNLNQKIKLLEEGKHKLEKLQIETELKLERSQADAKTKLGNVQLKLEESEEKAKIELEKSEEKAKLKLDESEEKEKLRLEESEIKAKLKLEESKTKAKLKLEKYQVEAENKINGLFETISLHEKRLAGTENDLKKAKEEFRATKKRLEEELERKESQIKNNYKHLAIGNELFLAAQTNRTWKKKFARLLKESRYFKIKRALLPFSGRKKKKFMDDTIQIIESGLFSPFYYLTRYPDVWRAGVNPLFHFCEFGWKEGRDPSPYFNCSAYLKQNGDVAKSGQNPLLHYIKYGKSEGRSSQVDQELLVVEATQRIEEHNIDDNCKALKRIIKNQDIPVLRDSGHEILVSILVLNRDGLSHLKVLLPALYKSTQGIKYELIVIDNASSDDSVSYMKNCGYDLNITIIENSENETFSKANNVAAKHAKGKYLVLLNNDVEPLQGWLHHLLYSVKTQENIGSVGSRLVYPYKESFRNSCTVQHAGISFRDEVGFFRPYNLGNGKLIESESVLQNQDKIALTAACLLVPAVIYQKIGGLDEGYNYGFEDVDFGLKLTQAGYRNYYCADSILFHYEFGTQKTNKREAVIKRRKINANLLRSKWFSTIKRNYWKEKLFDGARIFTESPLKVAIAVTDYGPNVTAGDYFTAQEIAIYLEKFGWTINYLSRLKEEWYQLDDDVDMVISLLDSYDITRLPKRNTRLTTIAWPRNWFDRWCETAWFNDYDMVFSSSHKACEYIRRYSGQEPQLLPIAANPERFINKPRCNGLERFQSDICFTGSYWNSPRDIMDALSHEMLQKYNFHVYGANWEKFEKFEPFNQGFVGYEEMPCVYHYTKIVIDDANHVTKPFGSVNSRVFDALMSGALVVTNGVVGSKDLFDGELPYYETSGELDQLLDFYLNNEAARKQKVNQLREMVLHRHTYAHRANTIRSALERRFLSPFIAIKIPSPTWEGAYSWGDYHMAVLLKKHLEKEGYRVLLQILPEWDNAEGMVCDVALVLRGLSRYTPKSHQVNIMWNISHPDQVTLEEYEEYDKVFIASDFWTQKIAKQVSVPVETMLQCTDPERFREPSEQQKERYKQQLLFVGNSRDVYRKVLKDLIPTNYDLAVYGKNWNKLIPKQYIKGEHIANDELFFHYGSAEILLNDHWEDMREKGFVSNRIFDGLACGAFIVTDKVSTMGELEDFVQVYETPEELKQYMDYFLNNPEERMKRAKKGMAYVAENHTFKVRARVFSGSIQKLTKVERI